MKRLLLIFIIPFYCLSQDKTFIERPSFNVTYITDSPKIDGDVINDFIWKNITNIGPMTQSKPSFGMLSSENTDIKVAFNNTTMFVGVVCYDSNPKALVVSDSRKIGRAHV